MIYFFLALEVILILVFIVISFVSKVFISKKTLIYSLPIFFITFGLYSLGYSKTYGAYDFSAFSNCIVASLKAFGFEFKNSYVSVLAKEDDVYRFAMHTSIVLSGLTLISGLLGIFKVRLINTFRVWIRISKNSDLLFGDFESCKMYAKKNKNSILIIDMNFYKLNSLKRQELYLEGIAFIQAKFSCKFINKIEKLYRKDLHFILFYKDAFNILNEFYESIDILKKCNNKTVYFHVEVNDDTESYYDNFIFHLNDLIKDKKIIIYPFNIEEMIANNFSKNETLALHMPNDFIKDGVVETNCEIDVVFIGFGKTNQAIFKNCLMNNQFIQVNEKGLYEAKPVNYFIFDKNKEQFENPFIKTLLSIDRIREATDNNQYFGKIDKICNIKFFDSNINSEVFTNAIYSNVTDKNKRHFKIFFVGLKDQFENVSIAIDIKNRIKDKDVTIYYKTDSKNKKIEEFIGDKLISYGFKNDIYQRKVLIDDNIFHLAELSNQHYNEKSNNNPLTFYELLLIEKKSNIYLLKSLEFKLNLFNLKTVSDSSNLEEVSIDEIFKIIQANKNTSYEDYFKINPKNTLIALEHLRWEVFYLFNSYSPMKKEDIYFDENKKKIIHKNGLIREHAFITSFYGIDAIHKYEAQMAVNAGLYTDYDEALNNIETYKYDLLSIDLLKDFLKTRELKIVKKP